MVPRVHVEVASLKSCVQRLAPYGGGGVPKSIDKEKKIVHMKGTCENDTKTEI